MFPMYRLAQYSSMTIWHQLHIGERFEHIFQSLDVQVCSVNVRVTISIT